MTDWVVFGQGYKAGLNGEDDRSNPYETTHLVLDWIRGYNEGEEQRRQRLEQGYFDGMSE